MPMGIASLGGCPWRWAKAAVKRQGFTITSDCSIVPPCAYLCQIDEPHSLLSCCKTITGSKLALSTLQEKPGKGTAVRDGAPGANPELLPRCKPPRRNRVGLCWGLWATEPPEESEHRRFWQVPQSTWERLQNLRSLEPSKTTM